LKKAITKNTKNNIHIFDDDAYNLPQILLKNKLIKKNSKVDLITIGEAYHWFEEDKILHFCKDLLKSEGTLAIVGYTFEPYNRVKDENISKKLRKYFEKILPYYKMNNLEGVRNGYLKSDKTYFQKYFKHVERTYHTEETIITFDQLFNSLRSSSAYVNYVKENERKEGYLNPVERLKKSFVKKVGDQNRNVTLCMTYYLITLKN